MNVPLDFDEIKGLVAYFDCDHFEYKCLNFDSNTKFETIYQTFYEVLTFEEVPLYILDKDQDLKATLKVDHPDLFKYFKSILKIKQMLKTINIFNDHTAITVFQKLITNNDPDFIVHWIEMIIQKEWYDLLKFVKEHKIKKIDKVFEQVLKSESPDEVLAKFQLSYQKIEERKSQKAQSSIEKQITNTNAFKAHSKTSNNTQLSEETRKNIQKEVQSTRKVARKSSKKVPRKTSQKVPQKPVDVVYADQPQNVQSPTEIPSPIENFNPPSPIPQFSQDIEIDQMAEQLKSDLLDGKLYDQIEYDDSIKLPENVVNRPNLNNDQNLNEKDEDGYTIVNRRPKFVLTNDQNFDTNSKDLPEEIKYKVIKSVYRKDGDKRITEKVVSEIIEPKIDKHNIKTIELFVSQFSTKTEKFVMVDNDHLLPRVQYKDDSNKMFSIDSKVIWFGMVDQPALSLRELFLFKEYEQLDKLTARKQLISTANCILRSIQHIRNIDLLKIAWLYANNIYNKYHDDISIERNPGYAILSRIYLHPLMTREMLLNYLMININHVFIMQHDYHYYFDKLSEIKNDPSKSENMFSITQHIDFELLRCMSGFKIGIRNVLKIVAKNFYSNGVFKREGWNRTQYFQKDMEDVNDTFIMVTVNEDGQFMLNRDNEVTEIWAPGKAYADIFTFHLNKFDQVAKKVVTEMTEEKSKLKFDHDPQNRPPSFFYQTYFSIVQLMTKEEMERWQKEHDEILMGLEHHNDQDPMNVNIDNDNDDNDDDVEDDSDDNYNPN